MATYLDGSAKIWMSMSGFDWIWVDSIDLAGSGCRFGWTSKLDLVGYGFNGIIKGFEWI